MDFIGKAITVERETREFFNARKRENVYSPGGSVVFVTMARALDETGDVVGFFHAEWRQNTR